MFHVTHVNKVSTFVGVLSLRVHYSMSFLLLQVVDGEMLILQKLFLPIEGMRSV